MSSRGWPRLTVCRLPAPLGAIHCHYVTPVRNKWAVCSDRVPEAESLVQTRSRREHTSDSCHFMKDFRVIAERVPRGKLTAEHGESSFFNHEKFPRHDRFSLSVSVPLRENELNLLRIRGLVLADVSIRPVAVITDSASGCQSSPGCGRQELAKKSA